MKGFYYIYDREDNFRPETCVNRSWSGEIVNQHENKFSTFDEACNWKSLYNHRYISRAPWNVYYDSGLAWKEIKKMCHCGDNDYLPEMMSWFVLRFAKILDIRSYDVLTDKKEEFMRYCKDLLRFEGDDDTLKGIIMQMLGCDTILYEI